MSVLTARVTASEATSTSKATSASPMTSPTSTASSTSPTANWAEAYLPYGRTLMVIDEVVIRPLRDSIDAYFAHYGIDLTVSACTSTKPRSR